MDLGVPDPIFSYLDLFEQLKVQYCFIFVIIKHIFH